DLVDHRAKGHTTCLGCGSRGLLIHLGQLVRSHGVCRTSLRWMTSGRLTCCAVWLLPVALCLLIAGVLLLLGLLNRALKSLSTEYGVGHAHPFSTIPPTRCSAGISQSSPSLMGQPGHCTP